MSSTLTTAALALPGIVAYYPMEDAGGATTAADAGSNAQTLSLVGTGASTHILPGQAAQCPGSLGSWSADATVSVGLQKTVAGGSPFQLASAYTLFGWYAPTAQPTASRANLFGRSANWSVWLQNSTQGGGYGSGNNYYIGQTTNLSGTSYVAIVNNGPANGGAVTPGTNTAVWEPLTLGISFATFTTLGSLQQNTVNPVVLNKPNFFALTWDGTDLVFWLNGVREVSRMTQPTTASPAWDAITQTTDAFQVFGAGGNQIPGYAWGIGVSSVAFGRGELRSIYLAGIGAGNEIVPTFSTIDTVRDTATPLIASSGAISYYCSACGGGMRSAEGYLTISSKRYHHGCYTGARIATTAALLGNASVMNDMADRSARLGWSMLLTSMRRENIEKRIYHDGTYLNPYGNPTNPGATGDWIKWIQATGGFAAMLSRYTRASRESWLTLLASQTMEFLISCMIGIPSAWLAPGRVSLAGTPTAGALSYGAIVPAYNYANESTGTNHGWALNTMCRIYLCLKRQVSAATLNRWQQAIVAGANWLVSGGNLAVVQNPVVPNASTINSTNQYYYVNGNFMIRYAIAYYQVYLVTGDQRWLAHHNAALSYTLQPYSVPLTWQGTWVATNTYSTTGDGINGPHAVRYSGGAYKCISNIAGSAGNSNPSVDGTHWSVLETGNVANRQGFGLVIDVQGADSTYWSDYRAHLNEYGSGAGGGAPGSPLAGQPGYDGDYNAVQQDDAAYGYLLTGNPTYRQLANALMNTSGVYPAGGAGTNPQATPFSFAGVFVTPGTYNNAGGANTPWVIDKGSGQSGGYSTRHNLLDGYRSPWLPIAQLLGYRPDISTGFGTAMFVSQFEAQAKAGMQFASYNSNYPATMESILGTLMMASPSWPGFPA